MKFLLILLISCLSLSRCCIISSVTCAACQAACLLLPSGTPQTICLGACTIGESRKIHDEAVDVLSQLSPGNLNLVFNSLESYKQAVTGVQAKILGSSGCISGSNGCISNGKGCADDGCSVKGG